MEATSYRTHGCGALRLSEVGQRVRVAGWVRRVRDLGRFVFVDLRDRSGLLQLVALEESPMYAKLRELGREWVIQAEGILRRRESPNPTLPTGEVELLVEEVRVLNHSAVPPFLIEDETDGQEELRLRYRYLDLRRPIQQRRLELRARMISIIRSYLSQRYFLEVETPMLIRSTPEGARDFVVPSRLKPGTFYALPQSPQLLKQLLMVAGYDRYFQIARCFRDEDYRGDRQAEFTQLDCEMSFVTREEVLETFEGLVKTVFSELIGVQLPDFPRLTYAEAMRWYGSDKPDLRYSFRWEEVSEWARQQPVPFWKDKATFWLWVPQVKASRKIQDTLQTIAKDNGASSIAFIQQERGHRTSSLSKFLSIEELPLPGDGMGIWLTTEKLSALGAVRQGIIQHLNIPPETPWAVLWVIDFPLFEADDNGRLSAAHHPFVHPHPEDLHLIEEAPLSVRALAYDLVVNGNELMSGSLRCHTPELQMRVFRALGLSEAEAKEKFGFLLEALSYGAPPHGGCAFGIDRWVMLMAGAQSLREVIAFPKTASGADLMLGAPAPLEPEQKAEILSWLSE
ncbi:MAG: aspartate--tRNA ligase [Bacteroidia bacterium]|nr:aspartate--tRNA ligase [Bacteroidia bacterium]MCX7652246.1 aspartate--tRNA ligase [Bacteroidia bacterium]MDW8416508.1 aspartate--tRNA ligase [Bacteroidia bacterium]